MKKNKQVTEIEYEQNTGDYSVQKSNGITGIIAFIVCVLVAACIWAYALNLNDPILEKEVTLKYDYVGFINGEFFKPEGKKITVYGTKSSFDRLEEANTIVVTVTQADFVKGDTVDKKISFPKGLRPAGNEDKSVEITVIRPTDK